MIFRQILKSKLQRVIITEANTDYEGSLTLDPDLMDAADLVPRERVEVNAVYGSARIVTYVIPGERGTGQVGMNGGAANFFGVGDEIHVNCFAMADIMMPEEIVVKTDENNKVIYVDHGPNPINGGG